MEAGRSDDVGLASSHAKLLNDNIQVFELYKEYRAYVMHEDNLMNNRVNWFIQLHSFLIASYVITITGTVTSFFPSGKIPDDPRFIQLIVSAISVGICVVGLRSSNSAILSIRATTETLTKLRQDWDAVCSQNPISYKLPALTYGGALPAWIGQELEGALPRLMKWVWIPAIIASTLLAAASFHVTYVAP